MAGMKQVLLMIAAVALVGCASPTFTSDPSNPQNVIVENAIRKSLKKPTGELTKADLKKVQRLNLYDASLTDEGMVEVAKLTRIKWLNLENTHITDACIDELAKMKQLESLSVYQTSISKPGYARLKKALPKCKFRWPY